jgi:hypothetical protein
MNVDVNVNKLVEQIAQKLGVAAEKVYPMLYKQAMIDGVFNLLLAIGLFALLYLSGKWLIGVKSRYKQNNKYLSKSGEDMFIEYPFQIIGSISSIILSPIFGFVCLKTALDALVNPNLYVIKQVLSYL